MKLKVAGETLQLLPEKAIFWEERRWLLVADVHLGKAAALRAGSIPVPGGTTEGNLDRLDRILGQTDAEHVVFLGDLWHARAGRTPSTESAFATWRSRHSHRQMTLVVGNHDLRSGPLPAEWKVGEVLEPWEVEPFSLRHMPGDGSGYRLAGHVHPAVELLGRGRQSLRLPCFWFSPQQALLPAFGEFTGVATVSPRAGDRVFGIVEDQVLELF